MSRWSRLGLHTAIVSGGVGLVVAIGHAVVRPGPPGLAGAPLWSGIGVLLAVAVAVWLVRRTNGSGHGLTNLQDREALGGILHIEGRPGSGTCVHAELPMAVQAPC